MWYNSDESKSIDIGIIKESKYKDLKIIISIGLNSLDLHLEKDGKKVCVELIASSMNDENDFLEHILSTTAFEIMDSKKCRYGSIFENIILMYNSNLEMKHVLLLSPAIFDEFKSIETDDKIVAWLYIVPISDNERDYIYENGIDSFDSLLEQKNVDVLDYNRKSCV